MQQWRSKIGSAEPSLLLDAFRENPQCKYLSFRPRLVSIGTVRCHAW